MRWSPFDFISPEYCGSAPMASRSSVRKVQRPHRAALCFGIFYIHRLGRARCRTVGSSRASKKKHYEISLNRSLPLSLVLAAELSLTRSRRTSRQGRRDRQFLAGPARRSGGGSPSGKGKVVLREVLRPEDLERDVRSRPTQFCAASVSNNLLPILLSSSGRKALLTRHPNVRPAASDSVTR